VLGACAAQLGLLAPRLVYPDLNLAYPFVGADGRDWLANGLALAGADVRYTGRSPLVPLLLAGLDRLGGLALFPVAQQLVLCGLVLVTFRGLRRTVAPAAAAVAALALLASARLQALALEVSADPAAALLLAIALGLVLAGRRRPVAYLAAGLAGGLGALTQSAVLWLVPAAAAGALVARPPAVERWALAGGAAIFAALPLAWETLGPPGSGRHGIVGAGQWSLLAPGLANLPFYLGAALGWLGWPAALLVLGETLRSLPRLRRDPARAVVLALLAGLLLFFAVGYRWPAARFLVYAAVPASVLLAGRLDAVRSRRRLAALAAATLLLAAWPLPAGAPESAFVVWPLPTVTLDPAAPPGRRLARGPVADAWRASAVARVWHAWRHQGPVPLVDPRRFAGDHSIVYLARESTPVSRRNDVWYRLGNAARRRVKVAPGALYPPDWFGFGTLEPAGEVGDLRLLRTTLPGRDGSWVIAVDRDAPLPAAGGPAGRAAPPPAADLARAWRIAEAIAGAARPPDGLVAALADPRPEAEWLRLLPFAARTTSLFILDRLEPAVAPLFAGPADGRSLDGLVLVERRHLHWPVLVVIDPGRPPAQGPVQRTR
jgi:hypothetical protein